MNIRIKIFIIILIFIGWFLLYKSKSKEQFDDSYATFELTSNPDDLTYVSDLTKINNKHLDCCLVEKKYVEDNKNPSGGSFKYDFQKLSNANCDLSKTVLNSSRQIFIDGENNWSNEYCTNNNNILGSCRNINKECIDFVDKKFCDDYKMTWSKKSCHDPLDFVWQDRISAPRPPASIYDGSVVLFK